VRFFATLPPGLYSPRAVERVLTALGDSWAEVFRANPTKFPPFYSLRVRFTPEHGTENWQSPPDLIKSRSGDCEDLVLYRYCELASHDYPIGIQCVSRRELSGLRQHVRLIGDGMIEDPSLVVLGRETPKWPREPR
jgi:hypothetical protein